MASRLLRAAEEVRFLCDVDHEVPMSVIGMLGQELRILDLPFFSFYSAFFSALPSQFLHLKSLLVRGELKGEDPIFICHPTLETLKIGCEEPRSLTIDCPNLTYLSTDDEEFASDVEQGYSVPSLFCPLLTTLCLSPLHCTSGVLESMAAHAPNV